MLSVRLCIPTIRRQVHSIFYIDGTLWHHWLTYQTLSMKAKPVHEINEYRTYTSNTWLTNIPTNSKTSILTFLLHAPFHILGRSHLSAWRHVSSIPRSMIRFEKCVSQVRRHRAKVDFLSLAAKELENQVSNTILI